MDTIELAILLDVGTTTPYSTYWIPRKPNPNVSSERDGESYELNCIGFYTIIASKWHTIPTARKGARYVKGVDLQQLLQCDCGPVVSPSTVFSIFDRVVPIGVYLSVELVGKTSFCF